MTSARVLEAISGTASKPAARAGQVGVLETRAELVIACKEIHVLLKVEDLEYAQEDGEADDGVPLLKASDRHPRDAYPGCHLGFGDASPQTRKT